MKYHRKERRKKHGADEKKERKTEGMKEFPLLIVAYLTL
jgi:hypothetical protein